MTIPLRLSMAIAASCMMATPVSAQNTGPATARLDPFISAVFEAGAAPGFAIAVVHGTEVVYMKGFGYADIEAGRPSTTPMLEVAE